MPTAREQLLLDLAAILADPNGPAEQVSIGSLTLRAVRDLPALVPGDAEGLLVERQTLYLLAANLGFQPVSGQELAIDGGRWEVESCPPGPVVELHLMRYRT
jgi:hypothetical protein